MSAQHRGQHSQGFAESTDQGADEGYNRDQSLEGDYEADGNQH